MFLQRTARAVNEEHDAERSVIGIACPETAIFVCRALPAGLNANRIGDGEKFQSNLLSNGYNVVKQNSRVTILSDGTSTVGRPDAPRGPCSPSMRSANWGAASGLAHRKARPSLDFASHTVIDPRTKSMSRGVRLSSSPLRAPA